MKIELQLRGLQDDQRTDNPTILVSATITEGDSVTAGSQYYEEFSLPALADFLTESRSARTIDVDSDEENADGLDFSDDQPESTTSEAAMAADVEVQAEEDAGAEDPNDADELAAERASESFENEGGRPDAEGPDKNELSDELNPDEADEDDGA